MGSRQVVPLRPAPSLGLLRTGGATRDSSQKDLSIIVYDTMGSRQVVRHMVLVHAFGGSNPSSPATVAHVRRGQPSVYAPAGATPRLAVPKQLRGCHGEVRRRSRAVRKSLYFANHPLAPAINHSP